MKRRYLIFLNFCFAILFLANNSIAQKSLIYTHEDMDYKRGLELFEKQKFGSAQISFRNSITSYGDLESDIKTNAEFYYALCAIELFNNDAEYLISKFISERPESPKVKSAYFYMAKFQYRKKKYSKTIDWFEKVDRYSLNEDESAEYYFKIGYSYFMENDLEKAKNAFYEIKDVDTKYTPPAIYYYSHIAYSNENYETALQGFKRLSQNETFSGIVPYYIIQIYYLQKKYDEVINYGPPLLKSASISRIPEIARFVGEAYYQNNRYKESIPYLEMYMEKARNISREDKYRLAYTYYLIKEYEKASKLFKKVATRNDLLSQNSYYHLAECFINLGDKSKALMAFSSAGKLDFDKRIKEDALFNYAVITYELSYSPFNEAIKALNQYIENYPNAERIDEAYNFLVMAYMNTRNYKDALVYLEKIKIKDNSIKKAYQRVAFYRALELYNNLRFSEAIEKFDKSLDYSEYDRSIKARSHYWKAEAYYRLKNYDKAIDDYNKFLLSAGAFQLDEYKIAHYNLGYCCFNKKEYSDANTWFRKYVNLTGGIKSKTVGDAYNRIADSFFILSNYWIAIDYYDKAIGIKISDPDYALFQKGFSLGLVNRHEKKITTLDQLTKDYSKSAYVDDALFEIGKSYVIIHKPDKAIQNYQKIIDEYPSSSYVKKAILQLGLIYYNNDRNQEALKFYKRVIAEFPGTPEAKYSLTGIKNIYVDLNQVDTYIQYVNGLGDFANVRISEQDSLTYLAAEKVYMSGDCNNSKEYFKQYIEKFRNGNFILNAHFYKAGCNYIFNEYEEAMESYNFVIGKPKNTFTEQALLGSARINFTLKNYKDALENYKMLENVAEIKSNLSEARIGQMRSFYLLNNYSSTIEAAGRVLLTEKISDEIIREARFKIGKSFLALNDLESAINEFRRVASEVKSAEGAESKFRVAEIYLLQKKNNLTENEIFDFVSQNTPHKYWIAKSFILLSDVFSEKEDYFQAKATLQSIIDGYEINDDGIIDQAREKLNRIIEKEKAEEKEKEEQELEIDFDNNRNGKYDKLFKEEEQIKNYSKFDPTIIKIDTTKPKILDTINIHKLDISIIEKPDYRNLK